MAENSATRKLTKAALQQEKAERAIKVAKKQLGDPYVWGATGPGAFDCSGLVQFAWRKAGVKLPRTTWAMLRHAKKRVSLSHLKPGDLIFTSGGGHVGMYLGHRKVISAPTAARWSVSTGSTPIGGAASSPPYAPASDPGRPRWRRAAAQRISAEGVAGGYASSTTRRRSRVARSASGRAV